jgi:hypothetical protein
MPDFLAATKRPSSKLTIIGIVLTLLYLGAFGYFSNLHFSAFENLKPNEWADFLAGAFAPLAFLWLVLGFMQQGHELRQSAHALFLQSEELRNSVEQQRALVEATREQIEFDRDALQHAQEERQRRRLPQLRAHQSGGITSGVDITRNIQIENYGTSCTNVIVEVDRDGNVIGSARQSELPKGGSIVVGFGLTRDININGIRVSCRFVDQENVEGNVEFLIFDEAPEGDFFSFKVTPVEN